VAGRICGSVVSLVSACPATERLAATALSVSGPVVGMGPREGRACSSEQGIGPREGQQLPGVSTSTQGTVGLDSSPVVLATKLSVPKPRSRVRVVARPQLLQVLRDGVSRRVTLVRAPTGWGKTMAVAEWARCDDGSRFAWVALDPGDDEPARFWSCVVAALETVRPKAASVALRRLRSPAAAISDEVLPGLVSELSDASSPVVLVIDDFHLIRSSAIHVQLEYLLNRLPSHMHVVLIANAVPGVRLGRIRAMGELAEIGPDQLRFSDAEATALLNRVHALELTPTEVEALQDSVEGWVAGLNLAALSLKRSQDPGQLINGLPVDDELLVEYLWNEVVAAQPEPVQQFLTYTAVVEQFTGSLADALTGRSDGAAMVRELERANLFVVPLDDVHVWFRYHHLFRALLRGRLESSTPALVPELHGRASDWYAARDLMVDAINHAIAGGDMDHAADEIEQRWFAFFSAADVWTLVSWMDRLSAEAIEHHPILAVVRAGVARAIGHVEEIDQWLARVEPPKTPQAVPGLASSIEGAVAEIRSMYLLAIGDVPGAIKHARQAQELEPIPGSAEHAIAGYFLGVASFFDDPEQASSLLQTFLDAIPARQQDPRHWYAMALLAEVWAMRGEVDRSEQLARAAMARAIQAEIEEYPPINQYHIALGAARLAHGDLDAAEEQFERAVVLSRRGGDRVEMAHALLWLAALRAQHGEADLCAVAIAAARELVPDLGRPVMSRLVDHLGLRAQLRGSDDSARGPGTVSDAELRVLRLMPGELTYREIAGQLFLSYNTVRTHAQRVLHKLGASSRADAVSRARAQDLL
jgi:LuxR family transcriptional regulator, maltose regulon positive regulatory protein